MGTGFSINAGTGRSYCDGPRSKDENEAKAEAEGQELRNEAGEVKPQEQPQPAAKLDLNDPHVARMKRAFDRFDLDHNGYLDRREVENLLKQMYTPTEQEQDEFLAKFDKNKDGFVSWKEFRNGILKVNNAYRKPENAPFLRALFQKFDINGDDKLSREEMVAVARYTLSVPEKMKDKIINGLDDNKDGLISFDEFSRHMDLLYQDLGPLWDLKRPVSEVDDGLQKQLSQ